MSCCNMVQPVATWCSRLQHGAAGCMRRWTASSSGAAHSSAAAYVRPLPPRPLTQWQVAAPSAPRAHAGNSAMPRHARCCAHVHTARTGTRTYRCTHAGVHILDAERGGGAAHAAHRCRERRGRLGLARCRLISGRRAHVAMARPSAVRCCMKPRHGPALTCPGVRARATLRRHRPHAARRNLRRVLPTKSPGQATSTLTQPVLGQ